MPPSWDAVKKSTAFVVVLFCFSKTTELESSHGETTKHKLRAILEGNSPVMLKQNVKIMKTN